MLLFLPLWAHYYSQGEYMFVLVSILVLSFVCSLIVVPCSGFDSDYFFYLNPAVHCLIKTFFMWISEPYLITSKLLTCYSFWFLPVFLTSLMNNPCLLWSTGILTPVEDYDDNLWNCNPNKSHSLSIHLSLHTKIKLGEPTNTSKTKG